MCVCTHMHADLRNSCSLQCHTHYGPTHTDSLPPVPLSVQALRWYASILALTILGVLFAISMPLCCCVICCCRCCNKCGADLTSSIDDDSKEGTRRVACWVELVIVVLLSILVG